MACVALIGCVDRGVNVNLFVFLGCVNGYIDSVYGQCEWIDSFYWSL